MELITECYPSFGMLPLVLSEMPQAALYMLPPDGGPMSQAKKDKAREKKRWKKIHRKQGRQ